MAGQARVICVTVNASIVTLSAQCARSMLESRHRVKKANDDIFGKGMFISARNCAHGYTWIMNKNKSTYH